MKKVPIHTKRWTKYIPAVYKLCLYLSVITLVCAYFIRTYALDHALLEAKKLESKPSTWDWIKSLSPWSTVKSSSSDHPKTLLIYADHCVSYIFDSVDIIVSHVGGYGREFGSTFITFVKNGVYAILSQLNYMFIQMHAMYSDIFEIASNFTIRSLEKVSSNSQYMQYNGAILGFILTFTFIILATYKIVCYVCRRKSRAHSGMVLLDRSFTEYSASFTRQWIPWILVLGLLISLPWEFTRIYQEQMAKKAAVTLQGMPPECIPNQMSTWLSVKSWFMWQFSWGHDPCQKYHNALLVDPLWEVTPMMVVSSLLCRCVTLPVEMACAAIGRSLRGVFQEIPTQWQPLLMLLLCVLTLSLIIMFCRYRISLPLFLQIEPSKRTPNIVRTCRHRDCAYGDNWLPVSKSIQVVSHSDHSA